MKEFDLSKIAQRLEAMEESIIWRILERAQYKQNSVIYSPQNLSLCDNYSILDYINKLSEDIFKPLGKFSLAEEKPFFKQNSVPADVNIVQKKETFAPQIIDKINITDKIKEQYISFVPQICIDGDDGEYGSSAEADIAALCAISKRIHYGSFYVAESKFLSAPKDYIAAVKADDKHIVMAMLTRIEVEERIIKRVINKCEKIQDTYTSSLRKKIEPKFIGDFYKNSIIPLTKEGELAYLFIRAQES